MKKLLILALASAFVAAANAAGDWFKVAVSGSTQTPTGASWSTTPAAANVANSVISIDEDVDTALALTPTAQSPDAQTNTVVTVEATFTVVSDADSLESPGTDAKTALTVAKAEDVDYYYYWDGDSWEQVSRSTATPTSNQVTVRIELDNTSMVGTTATIKVDDGTTVATVATVSTQTKTKVSGLAFAGTGKIGNINADYTKADASYNGIYYATVGGAIAAKGSNSGDITVYAHNNDYPANIIKGANDVLLFPRTTTADQDGTATHPYEIASFADLKALVDLTAYDNTAHSFTQTVDIALTAAWEGIGVKAGKDLVNGSTKNIPEYEAGAFSGTYDGGNHTISNFQMENDTDYGALFNSINGATIKNLKVSYKENKLCANSSSTGGDTGATFVGVARNSTLQNLTALATESVTTVSASKDMAGIVGYLMAGSTVDSCTNELNVASLLTAKARKSGGIALITQDGTGTATIRNCKNSGTVTLANAGGQAGGIVGYVGNNTTIIDCENTAEVKVLTVMGSAALTMQGTNKGNATILSSNVATNGLNFATVDGNVATFVADNALAAGNTYKVMAEGATATYAFAAAGTIAFNTALATPTYAITTASGLKLENENPTPVANVTTYTARALYTLTVTVNGGANATAAWTVNGASVASAPATLTEGDTYSVTYTANSGYEFAANAKTTESGTAGTEDIVITIDNAVAKAQQPEVVSTAETTLVSVPKDCYAAELIDLSNRAKGDVLKAYNATEGRYYTWVLAEVGSDLVWEIGKVFVTSADESTAATHEESADTYQLNAGQAVWLTREDPSETIKLAVAAESDIIPASVVKGWNLIAPAPKGSETKIAINDVVSAGSATDQIKIPTAGAPLTCVYDTDKKQWGRWKAKVVDGIITGKEWESDVKIDAGTGFWYISDSNKEVQLGK